MATPSKIDLDKVHKCYYCDKPIENMNDVAIKKFPMATRAGIRQFNRKFHVHCLLKYNEKSQNIELKKEEYSDWDLVYKYFRKEILGLEETKKLQQHEINRLLGLRLGQYYQRGNNTMILPRGYTYKEILITLKVVKPKVHSYLATGNFANHKHKIDGIMRFVTGEINDVSKRLEAQRKANEKIEQDMKKEEQPTFDYKAMLKAERDKNPQTNSGINQGIQTLFGGNL